MVIPINFAGGYPVHRRSSIVLDHSGVCAVEGGPELGELCQSAEEIILSANEITQWSHVRKTHDVLL